MLARLRAGEQNGTVMLRKAAAHQIEEIGDSHQGHRLLLNSLFHRHRVCVVRVVRPLAAPPPLGPVSRELALGVAARIRHRQSAPSSRIGAYGRDTTRSVCAVRATRARRRRTDESERRAAFLRCVALSQPRPRARRLQHRPTPPASPLPLSLLPPLPPPASPCRRSPTP